MNDLTPGGRVHGDGDTFERLVTAVGAKHLVHFSRGFETSVAAEDVCTELFDEHSAAGEGFEADVEH